jgi:hypothetical protein
VRAPRRVLVLEVPGEPAGGLLEKCSRTLAGEMAKIPKQT